MSETARWLKRLDLNTFEGKRKCLFTLGHFIDFSEDWDEVRNFVESIHHQWFLGAVYSLQQFGHTLETGRPLKRDGSFGARTIASVQSRFCGCPDRVSERAGLRKWARNDITTWHDMEAWGMSFEETRAISDEAMAEFPQVCGLKITWTDSRLPDIFSHARRIDGRAGTLAWAVLPNPGQTRSGLEQRYDTADRLTMGVKKHEDGHSAGLSHSPNQEDVMYPSRYPGAPDMFGPGDIRELQRRYGEPRETEPDPEPPPTGELEERVAFLEQAVSDLSQKALFDGEMVRLVKPSGVEYSSYDS